MRETLWDCELRTKTKDMNPGVAKQCKGVFLAKRRLLTFSYEFTSTREQILPTTPRLDSSTAKACDTTRRDRPNRRTHRASEPLPCMIGILHPQSPPNKKNEGAWLARGTLLDNASRRYLAERHDGLGVRPSSLPGGPQRDVSPVVSSRTLLDGECKARGVRR